MRIVLYIAILLSLIVVPVKPLDVAKLEPVQTVAIRTQEKEIVLETDTGSKGKGKTVAEAIETLKKGTPGVIYLDTAQYLLLEKDASVYAEELKAHLNDRVRVCYWDGKGSVEMADRYLSIRKDLPLLKTVVSGGKYS